MLTTLLPIIGLIALATMAEIFATRRGTRKRRSPVFAKKPLSINEQPMYFRLIQAFPGHVVLAQVAFSAIIDRKSRHWSQRNDFNRLYADFVLCTKAFEVVAVIELDDNSHNEKGTQDEKRDLLLREAGYRVIRYKATPAVNTLQKDIPTP